MAFVRVSGDMATATYQRRFSSLHFISSVPPEQMRASRRIADEGEAYWL
jgi:hypothetical protein